MHIFQTLATRKLHSKLYTLLLIAVLLFSVVLMPLVGPARTASAFDCPEGMSQLDCDSVWGNWTGWKPETLYAVLCGDASTTRLIGGDNTEKTWNFFKQKGLIDIHTAAVVGNLYLESSLNPTIIQGGGNSKDPHDAGGGGWGIAQWTPGATVLKWAEQNNISAPIYELSTQLDLVWAQMKGTAPTSRQNILAGLKQQKDLNSAVSYFQTHFESGTNFEGRLAAAKLILAKYGGSGPVSGGDKASSGTSSNSYDDCSASGAVAGDEVKTALAYAWHKTYKSPHFEMKPAYRQAINKAQANGEFVGGGNHPGIDCGGFVTRVMRDSGVDPNYNNHNGNTDFQWAYLRTHPNKYKELGSGLGTNRLQPGDIAINSVHTFIYVGKQDGFPGNIAQASFGGYGGPWFAPQAGMYVGGAGSTYTFYRPISAK